MIGDAVQQAQFTIGGAVLAGLFLIVCGLVLLGLCFWSVWCAVRRYRDTDAKEEAFLEQTLPAARPLTAAVDTEPGIDLSLRDECFRILSVPNPYDDPDAVDRLLAAIHDESQKGETA
ncbi:hypothetical protein ACIGMX_34945 [Streptomyces aquilus]|uniref:hypothetical protein n=1 Tax=Streptomyces aquilus TaxID=2548456 RepID=UPI0037D8EC59